MDAWTQQLVRNVDNTVPSLQIYASRETSFGLEYLANVVRWIDGNVCSGDVWTGVAATRIRATNYLPATCQSRKLQDAGRHSSLVRTTSFLQPIHGLAHEPLHC